jgi:pimeloyl-ACP methyl ester carboxylesterase
VRKLILVGSGPFEEKYAANLMETRLSRLSEAERSDVRSLMENLNDPKFEDKSAPFARFGSLLSKADAYDPSPTEPEEPDAIPLRPDIFQRVWADGAEMRRNGELLQLGSRIECPVVAIHGDFDSHPAEGVEKPLSAVLQSFRLILLENCGHKPWTERRARDAFFKALRKEIWLKEENTIRRQDA